MGILIRLNGAQKQGQFLRLGDGCKMLALGLFRCTLEVPARIRQIVAICKREQEHVGTGFKHTVGGFANASRLNAPEHVKQDLWRDVAQQLKADEGKYIVLEGAMTLEL
jgi:hypothetical protein